MTNKQKTYIQFDTERHWKNWHRRKKCATINIFKLRLLFVTAVIIDTKQKFHQRFNYLALNAMQIKITASMTQASAFFLFKLFFFMRRTSAVERLAIY